MASEDTDSEAEIEASVIPILAVEDQVGEFPVGAVDSIICNANIGIAAQNESEMEDKLKRMTSEIDETRPDDAVSVAEEPPDEFYQSESWQRLPLHVFIMSFAGKPIFSRHGDENKLAAQMGVMQALDSFISTNSNQLQQIVAGDRRFIFLSRTQIVLVAVAFIHEPVNFLLTLLNYLYNQIIFTLTLKIIESAFNRSANLDLRVWLVDTDRHFEGVIRTVERSFGPSLGAVSTISVPINIRDGIAQAISSGIKSRPKEEKSSEDVVFGLLFTHCRLVSFVRMKGQFLHPVDIHLLINLIHSSESFKQPGTTHWLPVCLPKFDANGFLYANISYLDEATSLVLLSVDRNQFSALQSARNSIFEKISHLANGTCLDTLKDSHKIQLSSLRQTGIEGVRHFVFRFLLLAQYVSSEWGQPYTLVPSRPEDEVLQSRARVMACYRRMHAHLYPSPPGGSQNAVKQIFQAFDTEAFYAYKSKEYDLFITLEPLTERTAAYEIAQRLAKFVFADKKRLFILSTPTF